MEQEKGEEKNGEKRWRKTKGRRERRKGYRLKCKVCDHINHDEDWK